MVLKDKQLLGGRSMALASIQTFPPKKSSYVVKIQHLGPPIVPIFSIHRMAGFEVLDPAASECALI